MWNNIRYFLPVHFISLLLNILPDNVSVMKLRGFFLRPFFGKCGGNLMMGRGVFMLNTQNIEIGKNVYIAAGNWFNAIEKISIADEVMIAPHCMIISGEHTKANGSFRYGPITKAPVKIGFGSWIGAKCCVLAGTTIGKGSVVGANSVIKGKFNDDMLIAGIPAKEIKRV